MIGVNQKIAKAFISLKFRDYRFLMFSQFGTSMAMWMDQVARGWLIYEMTGSPFLLGLTGALKAFPQLLLSIFAGAIADRYSRKMQIIIAESINGALLLILAILVVSQSIQVWHVLVTALISGVFQAFHHPARVVLIADLVDNKYLGNAIAVNSLIFNTSRTVGPSISGLLIAFIGVGGAFFMQAFIHLLTIIFTAKIKEPPLKGRDLKEAKKKTGVFQDMMEGLKYIRSDQLIFALLIITLIPSFLGHPYHSLMPIFAKDILKVGPEGLGLLLSFIGIGSIAGALFVSILSGGQPLGAYLLAMSIGFAILLVFFALSPFFALSLTLLILVGFSQTGYNIINNTLIQTHTPTELRGRVMGFYFLDRGMMPLGTLLAGAMADFMGAPLAVSLLGAICALLAIAIAIYMPAIRHLR